MTHQPTPPMPPNVDPAAWNAAQAEHWLRQSDHYLSDAWSSNEWADRSLARAQVHATLAVYYGGGNS